jgi:hypothetical protein
MAPMTSGLYTRSSVGQDPETTDEITRVNAPRPTRRKSFIMQFAQRIFSTDRNTQHAFLDGGASDPVLSNREVLSRLQNAENTPAESRNLRASSLAKRQSRSSQELKGRQLPELALLLSLEARRPMPLELQERPPNMPEELVEQLNELSFSVRPEYSQSHESTTRPNVPHQRGAPDMPPPLRVVSLRNRSFPRLISVSRARKDDSDTGRVKQKPRIARVPIGHFTTNLNVAPTPPPKDDIPAGLQKPSQVRTNTRLSTGTLNRLCLSCGASSSQCRTAKGQSAGAYDKFSTIEIKVENRDRQRLLKYVRNKSVHLPQNAVEKKPVKLYIIRRNGASDKQVAVRVGLETDATGAAVPLIYFCQSKCVELVKTFRELSVALVRNDAALAYMVDRERTMFGVLISRSLS